LICNLDMPSISVFAMFIYILVYLIAISKWVHLKFFLFDLCLEYCSFILHFH
jgi:hypothetical protein